MLIVSKFHLPALAVSKTIDVLLKGDMGRFVTSITNSLRSIINKNIINKVYIFIYLFI